MYVTTQSLLGILMDCVCLGLVYTKISRGTTRASTMMFSDRAVVRAMGGDGGGDGGGGGGQQQQHLYLMFQVVEMRKHQLVEGHVRCYAVRDETDRCVSE